MGRLREDISELEWHPDVQAEAARQFSQAEPDEQRDMAMEVARRLVALVQPRPGNPEKMSRGLQCRTCALVWITCPELMGWRSEKEAAKYLGITPQTFSVHVKEVRRAIAEGVLSRKLDAQRCLRKEGTR